MTPQEAHRKGLEAFNERFQAIVEQINAALVRAYSIDPDRAGCTVTHHEVPAAGRAIMNRHDPHFKVVAEYYRERGWTVSLTAGSVEWEPNLMFTPAG